MHVCDQQQILYCHCPRLTNTVPLLVRGHHIRVIDSEIIDIS